MTPPKRGSKLQVPGSPDEWLTHAESDLHLARLAKDHTEILPEQVCFHAQQAAEKALKAVLLHYKIEFPLIHDIEALLEIVRQGGVSLPSDVAEAGTLTPYAVEARYPGYEEDITPEQVEEAIGLAESVVTWARTITTPHEESP
jgi:HEPN domain-containing protein